MGYDSIINQRGNHMVQVSFQASTELKETLEDMVEYWCEQQRKEGELIAGETAWKMIECIANAKQAQFAGLCD